jgi:hypothetical protein
MSMTQRFSLLSAEQLRLVEKYELWAFGRVMDAPTRELLVNAPAKCNAPGFWTGNFPGCERHNDFIEKWPVFRAALRESAPADFNRYEDEGVIRWMDWSIEEQTWESQKRAESEFWCQYRKLSNRPGNYRAGVAVLIFAAVIAIPFHVIGLAVFMVAGVVWMLWTWITKR